MKKIIILVLALVTIGFCGKMTGAMSDMIKEKLVEMRSGIEEIESSVKDIENIFNPLKKEFREDLPVRAKKIRDAMNKLKVAFTILVDPGLPPELKEPYKLIMHIVITSLSLGSITSIQDLVKGFYELLGAIDLLLDQVKEKFTPLINDLDPKNKDPQSIHSNLNKSIAALKEAEKEMQKTLNFFRVLEGGY